MKHTYFTTCPYCGAHLDPGERCDCPRASPGGHQYGNRTSTETGQVRKPDGCKKCTHSSHFFAGDALNAVQIIGKAVEVRHILNPAGSPESTLPQNDPKVVPV